LGILILVVTISDCRKAMCCGPFVGYITCIKGTDTINTGLSPGQLGGNVNILDSLNYYRNLGFTCTAYNLVPFTMDGLTYGSAIKQAESNGWGCVDPVSGTADPPECD
jgi:hypothetical protein